MIVFCSNECIGDSSMKSETNSVILPRDESRLFLFSDNFHNDHETGSKNLQKVDLRAPLFL